MTLDFSILNSEYVIEIPASTQEFDFGDPALIDKEWPQTYQHKIKDLNGNIIIIESKDDFLDSEDVKYLYRELFRNDA